MSEQTSINIIGVLVWFFIGAAVLSATRRGLLDLTESANRDESFKNATLPVLGVPGLAALFVVCWFFACILWPLALLRFFQRRGMINGHVSRECPHRILIKEREDKTRNIYRHGACKRRQQ